MGFPRAYGRYVLEERLAMGGMAEIFRARTATEGFEKRVCIKRVLPHFLDEEDFVTMFRDEARMAARLQHANVVQVFDFGEVEEEGGATLFLAMELVEGNDLRRIADASRKKHIPFTLGEVTQIGIDVCRGLHHAHTLTDEQGQPLGLVHRDVSPHNILVSRQGEVKVTDFGIAKAAERATHTSTGIVKGKVSYMSPEQAEGKPFDHRLDQWALGVILWELLCGARLFRGENDAAILRKVLNVEVPPPSEMREGVPPQLSEIILRALSGEPSARFADMREMELALSRFLFSGVIDPSSAEVRNVFPRIVDINVPTGPRRTNVMPAADVGPLPGASVPVGDVVASPPGASRAIPTVVFDEHLEVSTADQGQSALDTSTDEGERSEVFVSSESSPLAPGPVPEASLAPPTQLAVDPREAEAAAAILAARAQASSASGGSGPSPTSELATLDIRNPNIRPPLAVVGGRLGQPLEPASSAIDTLDIQNPNLGHPPNSAEAPTEAVDAAEAEAAYAEAQRLAMEKVASAGSRPARPAMETVVSDGLLAAEAARVSEAVDEDHHTPATRTFVPAISLSTPASGASPGPDALVRGATGGVASSAHDDDDLALPRSRAPMMAAAGLVLSGLVAGIAIAISPASAPPDGSQPSAALTTPAPPAPAPAPAPPPAPPPGDVAAPSGDDSVAAAPGAPAQGSENGGDTGGTADARPGVDGDDAGRDDGASDGDGAVDHKDTAAPGDDDASTKTRSPRSLAASKARRGSTRLKGATTETPTGTATETAPAGTAPARPAASGSTPPTTTPPPAATEPAAARAPGQVYVDVVGGWATVSIGKKVYGETPVTLQLPAGRYTLTLENGARKKSIPVTVRAGGKQLVREQL